MMIAIFLVATFTVFSLYAWRCDRRHSKLMAQMAADSRELVNISLEQLGRTVALCEAWEEWKDKHK